MTIVRITFRKFKGGVVSRSKSRNNPPWSIGGDVGLSPCSVGSDARNLLGGSLRRRSHATYRLRSGPEDHHDERRGGRVSKHAIPARLPYRGSPFHRVYLDEEVAPLRRGPGRAPSA